MGKRSREKGAEAERAAARILQVIFPHARRRVSGEEGQGTNLGRDIAGTPGWCFQVKEMASPSPLVALEEAIGAAGEGEMPAAIVRQARRGRSTPFRVVMTVRDFVMVVADWRGDDRAAAECNLLLDALSEDPAMKARID